MNNEKNDPRDRESNGRCNRLSAVLGAMRRKLGASRGQFLAFSLLFAVAATLWARPAATLLWDRLRIITGIPRMAVADENPEIIADVGPTRPKRLDAGRAVLLDAVLLRDPFNRNSNGGGSPSGNLTRPGSPGSNIDGYERTEQLMAAASSIRLSGTAKGLGTALLDGRARAIGDDHEAGGFTFRLVEVHTGLVVLETGSDDGEDRKRFLLDRNGAQPVPSD